MMKSRIDRLERIIQQRGFGSHEDYLSAINRVMACTRAGMEYLLRDREGEAPPQADDQDIEYIRYYEKANGIVDIPGAKERIESRLDVLRRRIFEDLTEDELRKLAGLPREKVRVK